MGWFVRDGSFGKTTGRSCARSAAQPNPTAICLLSRAKRKQNKKRSHQKRSPTVQICPGTSKNVPGPHKKDPTTGRTVLGSSQVWQNGPGTPRRKRSPRTILYGPGTQKRGPRGPRTGNMVLGPQSGPQEVPGMVYGHAAPKTVPGRPRAGTMVLGPQNGSRTGNMALTQGLGHRKRPQNRPYVGV